MNRSTRWFRICLVLAAFNLLTISCSLFLSRRLTNIQLDSTRVNQEWAKRLDRFSELADLGGAVNAPGNDVFDSQDVAGESARLATALTRFEKALDGAEAALAVNVPAASARLLGQDLTLVRGLMKEMTDETAMIFTFFRQSQPDKAGKRMATMDRKFALLTAGFAQLSSHVRHIQREHLHAQHFQAAALRRYELAIDAAVILMVVVLTISGHRMARAMHQTDEELHLEVAERRRSEQTVLESQQFLQSTLDALSAHIAILDESGVIISVNAAWDRFARDNEHAVTGLGAGGNYLEVCDRSRGECAEEAPAVARGIRAVLAGEMGEFLLEYPCHSAQEKRWFIVRVTRFGEEGARCIVVAHENITQRKQAEEKMLELSSQLIATSRQAGMAEIATGVLHNVGNVLNSVNVSANLLSDQVRKSPVADLGRVVALLREQGANLGAFFASDPRGPKVTNFLAELADKFTRQQESQLGEVAALQKNIEHIKEIVAMQQSYAKVSGLTENLSPVELIEDALRMNAGSFQKHEVELVRELPADLPRVCVDKHKVLQILVNLLRNAKHACDDTGRTDKRITVRAVNENERIRITISDNGVGIPPENLNRIFNHGFTTKKEGHGFGLHSAANAAKEMGGSLSVHSEGAGQGASFHLELPAGKARQEQEKAA